MMTLRHQALAVLVLSVALLSPTAFASSSPIADSAEAADRETVIELIGSGVEIDAAQVDGMTALHWAAYRDDFGMAQALVGAGASVSVVNEFGVTPLSLACQNGNAQLVELLLEKDADPNAELDGGETALMTAARTGKIDCVRALVGAGAKIGEKERRGQTALMWAASEGHLDTVEFLLASGADFREPLKSGFTPMLFAIRQGHADLVQAFLEAGADVNAAAEPDRPNGRRMRSGTSPLILAIENGHFELAVDLLKAGADPNDQHTGYTPLHTLTWVRKTVRGDGDNGIPTPEGSGALNSLDCARQLVEHGADPNIRLKRGGGGRARVHKKGATPFLMAAETCDLPYLKVLLELGADPNIPNVEDTLPIIAAAGLGVTAPGEEAGPLPDAIETVEYLLEIGADINTVDKSGETVMHAAAYKCEPDMIKLLDQRGAKIEIWNKKNKGGWTPLMIAQGFRPGNFRPIAEVEAAVSEIMISNGVTPPPPPERKGKKNDWAQPEKKPKLPKVDAQNSSQAAKVTDIEFARLGDKPLLLDLFRPKGTTDPTPLIVWIHGGAWRAGNRKSMPLGALVKKGYAIASVEYRLTPEAPFPANVHDIKAAIRFLRANAKTYGLDPDRFVIAGASAGGHLAALAGLTDGNSDLEGEIGEHPKTSSEVQAIVSFYGASNLTTILSQSTPHGLSVRVPALELLLEGQPDEKPELSKMASPIFQLDAKDPPVLLFHGDQDRQMPVEQAEELKQACDDTGVHCESHIVEGAGHGGDGFYTPEMIGQVARFLGKVFK